jgi:hypothetical protein
MHYRNPILGVIAIAGAGLLGSSLALAQDTTTAKEMDVKLPSITQGDLDKAGGDSKN